ncbi:hypothetical protein GALMADRAFT_54326 [Galerina marginata CBS 339.88]|uniref:Beta-glucuronidase C-terminal domain-containing protein n=1 Tax=Galerina marginata (strain CBS 339.88) TaxID=685588 RepID=A0A067TVL4_GALM3|nr:hypothetical protein GALMADRAFT_54326 [Galerina marginata CBS 339.88]
MLDPVFLLALLFVPVLPLCAIAGPIQISVPSAPPSTHVVQSNFLGISFELSFLDEYFGNDTSNIPPTIVNYLAALRSRTGNHSLRLRIGGNSMDSSTYVPSQTSPMVQLMDQAANANDQPVNYGPVLWDVLDKVASDIGGAAYLIGSYSLLCVCRKTPSSGAAKKLGDNLDAFLLGNEPDLYTSHLDRPKIQNYTTAIYIDEFRTASNHLTNTSAGDLLKKHDIGGPTICCSWFTSRSPRSGDNTTSAFDSILKYISLQHYPQNNCGGSYDYEIPYYVQHANVVSLGSWQNSGVTKVVSKTGPNRQEVILSEFNSASCGGIPTISDTFAVGSLWTIDYALQLASVGYSAAYIHTRERGISYNIFSPPDGPNGAPGSWTTNPPFYSLLVTAEALRSQNGSIVADLDISGSKQNVNATVSGYAVYDAVNSTVEQLVFFNFANVSSSAGSSASFAVPANAFSANKRNALTVKYLVGESMQEKNNIGWGGETFADVGDGKLVATNATWAPANTQVDCTNGCTITVPAPGMAVVFAGTAPKNKPSGTTGTTGSVSAGSSATTGTINKSASGTGINVDSFSFSVMVLCSILTFVLAQCTESLL